MKVFLWRLPYPEKILFTLCLCIIWQDPSEVEVISVNYSEEATFSRW
jgi:hypothetical protein